MEQRSAPEIVRTEGDGSRHSRLYHAGRALQEFLVIPLSMVALSPLLGLALYTLDRNPPDWLRPARAAIPQHFFSTSATTTDFLQLVAIGLFTKVSIVVTMLLLILQQTATEMGNYIYDQFLSKRWNQVFVGYVSGVLLVALTLRAMADDTANLVLSATVVFILVAGSMGFLVWFLHSTIEQMRPETIVQTIYDNTHKAMHNERELLARMRARPQTEHPVQVLLHADTYGFLVHIDLDRIQRCLTHGEHPESEVLMQIELGDYVAHHDLLAEIKAPDRAGARQLAQCIGRALRFDKERLMDQDPAYGIKQLEAIGWTGISSAKDSPETGLVVLHAMRDLMSRWTWESAHDAVETSSRDTSEVPERLPLVYTQDMRLQIFDAWESIATISSESLQHQVFAEVLHGIAGVYEQLPDALKDRADMTIRRAISALGDHVLTNALDHALHNLSRTLERSEREQTATMVQEARDQLAASLGTLANRWTRAGQSPPVQVRDSKVNDKS